MDELTLLANALMALDDKLAACMKSVSYTHLDVYKRQPQHRLR